MYNVQQPLSEALHSQEVSARNTWSVLAISWQAPRVLQEPWTRDFPSLDTTSYYIWLLHEGIPGRALFQFVSLSVLVVPHMYAKSRSVVSCSPVSSTDPLRVWRMAPTPPCRRPNV